jgi:hypothetical protein
MSIQDVSKALAGHPSFGEVTMRYENGGRIEVYQMGKLTVKAVAGASTETIRDAFNTEHAGQTPASLSNG